MAQVTHELKSPLASIQLHLETIKLRKPPAEKLERFLDTMLADTDRLNNLISNLLMTAKLEHRARALHYPVIDLSEIVEQFIEQKRCKLPEGGSLTGEVEKGIKAAVDSDGLETVLRNLYENAVLYSRGVAGNHHQPLPEGTYLRPFLSRSGAGSGAERSEKYLQDVFPCTPAGRKYQRYRTRPIYRQIGYQGAWWPGRGCQRGLRQRLSVQDHIAVGTIKSKTVNKGSHVRR